MKGRNHNARMAALWMAQGAAVAKLLRATGRVVHADNLEAALGEFGCLISDQVGEQTLSQAVDWVREEAAGHDVPPATATRH